MSKNNVLRIIVEIPKGSSNKYEYDSQTGRIILDRVLYGANFYPGEYGFIENTLDWDGDPLDVISLITYPTVPGCQINVRVLGTINMIDSGEIDTKLFGVVDSDPRFKHYQTLADVPQHLRDEIENFFLQYKALQKKEVRINGWSGVDQALKEIKECQDRYLEYKTILETEGKEKVMQIWKEKGLGQV
ncbi:inorganic diphosphatase [Spiroplasma mirum ATCC 29335]|uniref:Inorganic pyrophosphatase n=1 Tax=Spiroplasma mirum ATCC 29335 TaxID=838561 RepID=W0GQQ2_9MOLU|nr:MULTISPECIES: inorganic diphosphatase [Spiroplasma]AHF60876.1 inorganic pyrophosphatase [Spiroplasma mirum ATCC 29335]AHI57869.1 inorganic diphosphatase [Spiroplasma mirum ATCC 29335]AKM52988.1 inorganic pyrophosphatase [Spiroplasma atrichopogonis]